MALIKLLGSAPNQVSTNKNFGTMAWQNANGVQLTGDAVINSLTVGLGSGNIATNSAYGYQALLSNTTGYQNVSNGYQAGFSLTNGYANTFTGYRCGYGVTTGINNVFYGSGIASNTAGLTGIQNVSIGSNSLFSLTSGSYNTNCGHNGLSSLLTGNGNTSLGNIAGASTTGSNSTFIGYNAGGTATTGSNNIFIGKDSSPSATTVSNEITIGNSSNTVIRYPHSYSTVSALPSASTVGRGSRTFVTDASLPVFQAIVAGGGAVFTPVYSDGTNWRVG